MRALGILLVISTTAHAELEQKGVRAGGVVFAMSRDGDGENQGQEAIISRPGWMVGAFVTWRRSDTFALQLETALSNKLLRTELCVSTGMSSTGCMTTADISLYYLEVPLLLRLDLLPDDTKFHVDFGAELALTLGGGETRLDGEYRRFEDLLPFNLGAVLGIGLELPLGVGKLAIDVRYKRWLVPITGSLGEGDPPPGFGTPEQDIKPSHHVMLTAGYAFP